MGGGMWMGTKRTVTKMCSQGEPRRRGRMMARVRVCERVACQGVDEGR